MADKHTNACKSSVNKVQVCGIALLIAIVTYITFLPALKNEFTNWDDTIYVTENPLVVSPKVPVNEIWKTPVASNYHPLTMLSLAWNYQSGKLNPAGYHKENIVFHTLNVLLVFVFVYMLTRRNLFIAAFVSLFFGIHPMHVESVAWVSERKDVLYVFFFLAGLITYLQYREKRKIIWYFFCLILFVLSCLSKGMAVVLPVILLLIDYLQKRKWERSVWIEKTPFFILAFGFGILAFVIQNREAITDMHFFTWWQRVMFASYGACMYIVKLVVPYNLSAYYPYPVLSKTESIPFYFYLFPVIWVLLIATIYYSFKKNRVIVFGMLFYLVSVALVLQFISVGTVIMADRYSYLSYIGLLYIIAYFANTLWERKSPVKYGVLGVLIVIGIVFSRQAYARVQVWKNSETLWTDVIKKMSGSSQSDKAYVNRGRYYRSIQKNEEALNDYNDAIKINPAYDISYNNRGNIYRERGLMDAALADYNRAIFLNPKNYLPYSNRALIYMNTNESEKAMSDFTKSIFLNPVYWANYYNRGIFYYNIQDDEKAVMDFNKALELNYTFADIYNRRGMSYVRQKKYNEALNDFTQAISLNPNVANYWLYKSYVESNLGKTEEAQVDMQRGKELLGNQ